MVTPTGLYISGNLTETGRLVASGLTEEGYFVASDGEVTTTTTTSTTTTSTTTTTTAAPVVPKWAGISAVVALAADNALSALLSLAADHTLSGLLELEVGTIGSVAAVHPHGATVSAGSLINLGAFATKAATSSITMAGPGPAASVSAVVSLSVNTAASTATLSMIGPGSSAAISSRSPLSGASASCTSVAPIDPAGSSSSAALPVPLESYAGTASLSVPLALSAPQTVAGLTDYSITLNGVDITQLVDTCTLSHGYDSLFETVNISLPVAVDMGLSGDMAVTFAGVEHRFTIEDVGAAGPSRTVWGRSTAAVIDAPFAPESTWDETATPAATASALAVMMAGSTPLVWQAPDWPLPLTWSLSGTPAESLQQLAASVGAVVQATPAGGLKVVPRYTVRPVNMASSATVAEISRETALAFAVKQQHGKKWGSITVNGYDPSADLPDLDVEESDPKHGLPVHVKARWRRSNPPPFDKFLTDGSAVLIGSGTEDVEEQVVFQDGMASVRFPISDLISFYWIGRDGGTVWWLENGDSRELEMSDPQGYGIAMVNYTTGYQRFRLTGQVEDVVQFGVKVTGGSVSATVSLASGGPVAPQLIAPLLGDTAACIAAGTAALDAERDLTIINATVPLTGSALVPGALVRLQDELAGVVGTGQIMQVTTTLEPGKTTQQIEAILCN